MAIETSTLTASVNTTQTFTTRTVNVLRVAAGISFLTGLAHYAVVPEHLTHWWVYGAFFTILGAFELVWAALVFTGHERKLLLIGLVVNIVVLALWAVTRTVGLPFGPEAGQVEEVGILDTVCVLAELAMITALLYTLVRARVAAPLSKDGGGSGLRE